MYCLYYFLAAIYNFVDAILSMIISTEASYTIILVEKKTIILLHFYSISFYFYFRHVM